MFRFLFFLFSGGSYTDHLLKFPIIMFIKKILSGALVALLFGGEEPIVQFLKRVSWGTFM